MLRAILFDFDGTLFDTEPLHYRGLAEVLARRGIVLAREAYDRRYLGLGTDRDAVRQILEDFARSDLSNQIEAIVRDKAAVVASLFAGEVAACPGAAAFVAAAAERARLAIVSGALRSEVQTLLGRSRLARFFPVVIAAEDVSVGKPDPEGYGKAIEGIRHLSGGGLEARECLAVEDSTNGVLAARAAGLRVLALTHTRPREALGAADRIVAGYASVDWRDVESLFTDRGGGTRGQG